MSEWKVQRLQFDNCPSAEGTRSSASLALGADRAAQVGAGVAEQEATAWSASTECDDLAWTSTTEDWSPMRTRGSEPVDVLLHARTKKTKGAVSRNAGLAMAFKLLLSAEKRWRRLNAPHLVALIRSGVSFQMVGPIATGG